MNKQYLKKINLPDKPGVYFFKKGKQIIYIGKATSLRDRTKSYFSKDLIVTRGPLILDMTVQTDNIDFEVTDSVLEALILEANLIKKYQPKYNTKEKDNKSFNYVCITKEKLPKILVIRERSLNKDKYQSIFGPFPNGLQLRDAMKIIRRIFPFIDDQSSKKNNFEFYNQLGLVPSREVQPQAGPRGCTSMASLQYKNNIKNLKLFFQGKKKSVVLNLKKEMMSFAKKKEFEKANEIKKRIFALEHINDVALIKEIEVQPLAGFGGCTSMSRPFRIEAYDIAHMSGKNMVGVMTVVENNEVAKQEYKKFIIRTQTGANDTGALEEVLSRRFRHTEWGLPSLVVVDGSTAQINVAKRVLDRYKFNIPIAAVVKDDKHKAKAIMGDVSIIKKYKKSILLSNSEAHRFSIAYHKQKRNNNFLK
jgi:excinuclease ABC subunit C